MLRELYAETIQKYTRKPWYKNGAGEWLCYTPNGLFYMQKIICIKMWQ